MVPAALMMLTLSACAGSDAGRKVGLPDLPADLRADCPAPDTVRLAGRDARAAIADLRITLRDCGQRHHDTVAFYDHARKEMVQ